MFFYLSVKALNSRAHAASSVVSQTLVHVRAVEPVPVPPDRAVSAVESACGVDALHGGIGRARGWRAARLALVYVRGAGRV